MQTKELIEVMQCFENGGEVEWRFRGSSTRWMTPIKPSWNWENREYRIKEVPKKTKIIFEYLVKCVLSNVWSTCSYLYTEEEALATFTNLYMKTGRQFEVEA